MNTTFYLLCLFCTVLLAKLTHEEVDSLILCYKSKMEPLNGSGKYDLAFSNFNKKDLYKMFIDKKRLEINPEESDIKPKRIFDVGEKAEPGYYKGMKEAFSLMRTKVGEKVTLEMLIGLHDAAVKHIKGKWLGTSPGWHYIIRDGMMNDEAIKELVDSGIVFNEQIFLENISKGKNKLTSNYTTKYDGKILERVRGEYFSWMSQGSEGFMFLSIFPDRQILIKRKLINVIDHYYSQIEKVETLKGKIAAIAELIRALEVAHFFPDGNQRTYAFLLLNKLLIENNIPPAILDDPGMFDGYCTVEKMTKEIYKGIANFLNNDFANQKLFLENSCGQLDEAGNYLLESDYSPFFKLGLGEHLEKKFDDEFRKDIKRSIKRNKLEELDELSLSPLSKAVILGDAELVYKLISLGANPYCSKSHDRSPILTATKFFNFEIAKKLLSQINLDEAEPMFVRSLEYFLKQLKNNKDIAEVHSEELHQLLKEKLEHPGK